MIEDYIVQIEKAVLSAILFEPNRFEDIAAELSPKDFYLQSHKLIFETLGELRREELPLDDEFIKKKISKNSLFDEQILLDIISTNPIVELDAFVQEIKDRSIKRELNKLALTIKETTQDSSQSSNSVIDLLQSELYKITQKNSNSDFKESKEMVLSTLDHIAELKKQGNNILIGQDTGFHSLNHATTGFGKGDLVIIAARPAMGKTTFVLNIAQKNLDNNDGVVIFSLEMPSEQLMLRMLSAKTSISLQNLRVGNLNNEEWSRVFDAAEEMKEKLLVVDDSGRLNIHELRSKLRKIKTKHPNIKLAIIDYLQLMMGSGGKDRHLEVSEISRGLKLLARELDMPIIALSQLNRGVESRHDKRPMLSDLRESGSIEQDADIILFVYRDAVYRQKEEKEKEEQARKENKPYVGGFESKNEEDAEIIIGKQRNGPVGVVNLVFQKHCTRFVDTQKYPSQNSEKKSISEIDIKIEDCMSSFV